jgi:hypothetical protein
VARSVRALAPAALVIAAAGLLAGCTSTQTEAARERINNARILASQLITRVDMATAENPPVTSATRVTVLDRGEAFVVSVVNSGPKPVSNLPLSIGYYSHGKADYLNARVGLPYFASHTAEIRGRSTLQWVYSTGTRLPSGARPFAYLGSRADPAVSVPPTAGLSTRPLRREGSQWLVQVTNLTSIPQYQLPIYLYVREDGRIVGAGVSSLADLSGGATSTVRVAVIGAASVGNVSVEAPATIYN